MPRQRKASRLAQPRLECMLNPLLYWQQWCRWISEETADWRGTYKNIYNREISLDHDRLEKRLWEHSWQKGKIDFHQCGAKLTHLGLKLQIRHSKPPLDQPTQTDSDAAATSLKMCPCSYTAQTQVKLFISFFFFLVFKTNGPNVTYNSKVQHNKNKHFWAWK